MERCLWRMISSTYKPPPETTEKRQRTETLGEGENDMPIRYAPAGYGNTEKTTHWQAPEVETGIFRMQAP